MNQISNKTFLYLKKFLIDRYFLLFTLMISNLSLIEDKEALLSLLSSFMLTSLSSNVNASHVVISWTSASTSVFRRSTLLSSSSDETTSISSSPDSLRRYSATHLFNELTIYCVWVDCRHWTVCFDFLSKVAFGKQFLIVPAVTSFQPLATHSMACKTLLSVAISEASKILFDTCSNISH